VNESWRPLVSSLVPESNNACSFHRFGEILAKLIVRLPTSNTMNCPIMNACPKREPPPSPELCSAPVQTGLQSQCKTLLGKDEVSVTAVMEHLQPGPILDG